MRWSNNAPPSAPSVWAKVVFQSTRALRVYRQVLMHALRTRVKIFLSPRIRIFLFAIYSPRQCHDDASVPTVPLATHGAVWKFHFRDAPVP